MALIVFSALVPVVYAQEGESLGDVAPGENITLQGPEPIQLDYLEGDVKYDYLWTVDVDGTTITENTNKDLDFEVKDIEPGKTINVRLLVTDGKGCIGETVMYMNVLAPPVCGVDGDFDVCEDSPVKTYIYTGEDTTTAAFTFIWSVDGTEVGTTDEVIEIDWTSYTFGAHTLTLVVTKAYENGAFVESACEFPTAYIESPAATISLVRK